MAEQTKRYMELQMEELQETYGVKSDDSSAKEKETVFSEEDLHIASLYEDAWEYEQDLKAFEDELALINANELGNIAADMLQKLPDNERNYEAELKAILEAAWTNLVETEQSHPQEELDLIRSTAFSDVVAAFNAAFPDYSGDFEKEVRDILVKRWEMLIAIKKDHIKEEINEIKTAGLKHHFAKRIYKKVHGIE